ncbi:conserved Plasmodium protein, unknown function [Plasmodium relictum]|uniref:Uncharacterized protein n=1 Tax=Plasmodium relictum TaxID=85471 RepID=A0A1J1H0T1_PLARL|nr:conserved Plasmodium protein, unknown function [Plasmodium relictum]CRG98397.1 conserved Plasmodium protein, unknown function [Plasmodium relictum]
MNLCITKKKNTLYTHSFCYIKLYNFNYFLIYKIYLFYLIQNLISLTIIILFIFQMRETKMKTKVNEKINKNNNNIIKKRKKRKKKIIINVKRRVTKKEVINSNMKEKSKKENLLNKEITKYKKNNTRPINKFLFFEKEYSVNEIKNCQISEFLLKTEDK